MPYTVESLMTLLRAKRNDGPHKVSGYSLTHPLEGSKKVTAVSNVDAIMGLQEMLGTVLTDKTRFYRVNGKDRRRYRRTDCSKILWLTLSRVMTPCGES